jgi:hypothetical protein
VPFTGDYNAKEEEEEEGAEGREEIKLYLRSKGRELNQRSQEFKADPPIYIVYWNTSH